MLINCLGRYAGESPPQSTAQARCFLGAFGEGPFCRLKQKEAIMRHAFKSLYEKPTLTWTGEHAPTQVHHRHTWDSPNTGSPHLWTDPSTSLLR